MMREQPLPAAAPPPSPQPHPPRPHRAWARGPHIRALPWPGPLPLPLAPQPRLDRPLFTLSPPRYCPFFPTLRVILAPFGPLEAALRLLYTYAEGCGSGTGASTASGNDGRLASLVVALHDSDVAAHPHGQVPSPS